MIQDSVSMELSQEYHGEIERFLNKSLNMTWLDVSEWGM